MTYRYATSASMGETRARVTIDEVGNITAATLGEPRALVAILRLIANDIESETAHRKPSSSEGADRG